jgi:hypothetical protein
MDPTDFSLLATWKLKAGAVISASFGGMNVSGSVGLPGAGDIDLGVMGWAMSMGIVSCYPTTPDVPYAQFANPTFNGVDITSCCYSLFNPGSGLYPYTANGGINPGWYQSPPASGSYCSMEPLTFYRRNGSSIATGPSWTGQFWVPGKVTFNPPVEIFAT